MGGEGLHRVAPAAVLEAPPPSLFPLEPVPLARAPAPAGEPLHLCYADPPYLGLCRAYGHQHQTWGCFDDPATHRALITHLSLAFPDGWALSLGSMNLADILPMCPRDVRIGSWCKSFCSFKPGVAPAYAWEPVIFRGGRRGSERRTAETPRDYLVAPMAQRTGLFGTKPVEFCRWVLDLLGYADGDTLVDLFPGTGVMGRVAAQGRLL